MTSVFVAWLAAARERSSQSEGFPLSESPSPTPGLHSISLVLQVHQPTILALRNQSGLASDAYLAVEACEGESCD